jgi:hypothetical protein
VQTAQKALNSVAKNKNGMMQIVNQFGGNKMLDNAITTLDKHPFYKIAINGLIGGNIDDYKKQLQNGNNQQSYKQSYAQPVNNSNTQSIKDRLSKMK